MRPAARTLQRHAGHVLLLGGNEVMRKTALQRIEICCNPRLLPEYTEIDVFRVLSRLLREERDSNVRAALYSCLSKFAESAVLRERLLEAGVCVELRECQHREKDEALRSAAQECYNRIEAGVVVKL